jgi:hypothetical protein
MAIHGCSVTQAYGSVHKGLPGCLSKNEFLAMWKCISIANTPTNLANSASTNKPLWESVEESFNAMMRRLVIINRIGEVLMIRDDVNIYHETKVEAVNNSGL